MGPRITIQKRGSGFYTKVAKEREERNFSDLFCTEDNQGNEEPLVFLQQRQKQRPLENLMLADISRFVSLVTFGEMNPESVPISG
jgi:hypothetical protein